jgi:hypothetical protein
MWLQVYLNHVLQSNLEREKYFLVLIVRSGTCGNYCSVRSIASSSSSSFPFFFFFFL